MPVKQPSCDVLKQGVPNQFLILKTTTKINVPRAFRLRTISWIGQVLYMIICDNKT